MPIYEYECAILEEGCDICWNRFEIFQKMGDPCITECPKCGQQVRKIISWCRAAVAMPAEECRRTESSIRGYERQGMWSHAAELADKHSEKTYDQGMKVRALDNYKKAGYDLDLTS